MAVATAFLTAFYMFRMIWLTFFGKGKWEEHGEHDTAARRTARRASRRPRTALTAHAAAHDDHGHHGTPHESPWPMALPLAVLGILAVFSAGIALAGRPGLALVRAPGQRRAPREGAHDDDARGRGRDPRRLRAPGDPRRPRGRDVEAGAPEIVREYHEAWHHAHMPVLLDLASSRSSSASAARGSSS